LRARHTDKLFLFSATACRFTNDEKNCNWGYNTSVSGEASNSYKSASKGAHEAVGAAIWIAPNSKTKTKKAAPKGG
jgi:hypothetical protein